MSLTDRINRDRRQQAAIAMILERPEPPRKPFVAEWRRRSIEKAGGRFVAVAWRELPAA